MVKREYCPRPYHRYSDSANTDSRGPGATARCVLEVCALRLKVIRLSDADARLTAEDLQTAGYRAPMSVREPKQPIYTQTEPQSRVLYTRILLYRPLLARMTVTANGAARSNLPESSIEESTFSVGHSILTRSALLCVYSAREVIALISESLSSTHK